jgi:ABC-2 type transport system ATP-binding protein
MTAAFDVPWAIELSGFVKRYATGWGRPRTCAVQALTLRLAPGQVLGLLGPNGSGKSTTMKALAGLLRPSAGECRVFGQIAGSDAARALVGYLPDSPQFPAHLTGREFLHFCAGLSAIERAGVAGRVAEALRWVGLEAAADRKLGTYSKGMRQRAGLAQAVLHDPPLVLLDEPAGGLDPAGRLTLTRLIRDLAARGRTVVFSSHLLAQAEEVCDRIALLGAGRLLLEGTPADLLGTEQVADPQPSRLEKLYLEKLPGHA